MIDAEGLVGTVFSGLSALVIEDVEDAGDTIMVRARTRDEPVACPGCGEETSRVHGYHERTAADVPVDGRRVLVSVRVRRMRCPVLDCPAADVPRAGPGPPGPLPAAHHAAVRPGRRCRPGISGPGGIPAARRAGHQCLPAHGAARRCWRIRLPDPGVPRVLGIDDFALRKGPVYATILIDAETGRRVDVLEGRTADVVEDWLKAHPGVEIVCRDGSGAYGEAVSSALPGAVQCGDRWHLWHLLGEAAAKEVAAHSACWAEAAPLQQGKRAETTLERWQQVHDLRSKGAGLLDCSRRLGLSLNTVKRYDRAERARTAAARPAVPAHARRPLPRLPAQTARRGARGARAAAAAGNPGARLPGQLQPARPLHQPGPRSTPSGRTSHRARRPRSCSPGRTAFPATSARPRRGCQPPARR